MKIISIVGARPQFIKYGPLGSKLKNNFDELLVHTGQHYDYNMSKLLFQDLNIPKPHINLNIGSGMHGKQTGAMLAEIEKVLIQEKPDLVIVFRDTNSTLAGALAASKLHIKIAHVEAGLRSFNKQMPEEINRILTDHCADLLLCPTENSVENLRKENITNNVFFAGDIMLEAFNQNVEIAKEKSNILNDLELNKNEYFLATIHRAENTDNIANLKNIISAFNEIKVKVVLPLHPRTKKILDENSILLHTNIILTEPVGYLDMLVLLDNCKKVLTDSGGLQKEAFFANKYCKTLRNETEWVETLENNFNVLCGNDKKKIITEANKKEREGKFNLKNIFGQGNISDNIISYFTHNG